MEKSTQTRPKCSHAMHAWILQFCRPIHSCVCIFAFVSNVRLFRTPNEYQFRTPMGYGCGYKLSLELVCRSLCNLNVFMREVFYVCRRVFLCFFRISGYSPYFQKQIYSLALIYRGIFCSYSTSSIPCERSRSLSLPLFVCLAHCTINRI